MVKRCVCEEDSLICRVSSDSESDVVVIIGEPSTEFR